MCKEIPENQRTECNGGEGCCVYRMIDTVSYCDKGDHKERSLANQPNHRNHWKKVTGKNSQDPFFPNPQT